MKKFLCIQRSTPSSGGSGGKPSPEQMEAMMAKFNAWQEKYKDQILDMGGRLTAGAVVTADSVSDGPFTGSPEVAGGFMIVQAESMEQAVEVVKESPGVGGPGSSVEVREIG
jgi:hypothetical protein